MTHQDEARRLIVALGLAPHPEGGWYRQTWTARAEPGERPAGTAILFLLGAKERSHWHRVDADEIWLFHTGSPLRLSVSPKADGPAHDLILGPDVLSGERPQIVVPAAHWQSAVSMGAWTLVSCTVCPGFRFEGFELGPPGFDIPR